MNPIDMHYNPSFENGMIAPSSLEAFDAVGMRTCWDGVRDIDTGAVSLRIAVERSDPKLDIEEESIVIFAESISLRGSFGLDDESGSLVSEQLKLVGNRGRTPERYLRGADPDRRPSKLTIEEDPGLPPGTPPKGELPFTTGSLPTLD
ncbi:hypothetical protein FRC04_002998 [Tulasnella sp. 424]|nr:hypothetical protein FRC04_002998 [Tulasnella sp. 424]